MMPAMPQVTNSRRLPPRLPTPMPLTRLRVCQPRYEYAEAEHHPHFDGIWKEALRHWLPQCLALFWPQTHNRIDWTIPPTFLDKELRQLNRIVRTGARHVDVLVRLQLKTGARALLFIHLEIQAGRITAAFPTRMFQYHVRLLERHPGENILSCAILLDSQDGEPTQTFHRENDGCTLSFSFPVIHLAAWSRRMAKLKAQAAANPFAVMVLAQLEYRATRPDSTRLVSKLALGRALAKWNYSVETQRILFWLMDSLLTLPEDLNDQFLETMEAEETVMMDTMNSYERLLFRRERTAGIAEGEIKGKIEGAARLLETQLQRKFGAIPDWATARIAQADTAVLQQWGLSVLDAQRIEDVFQD